MPERLADLGSGLELWRAAVDELAPQPVNPRSMPPRMFQRLVETVGRDGRLESLPFCCLRDSGRIEIVSGHHRVDAARKAGLAELYVLVDVTGLSDDQIRAKQLAHNSICGVDDEATVQLIFSEIEDVECKLEAFVDLENLTVDPVLSVPEVRLESGFRSVQLMFLPEDWERLVRLADRLRVSARASQELLLADERLFERFCAVVGSGADSVSVRAVSGLLVELLGCLERMLDPDSVGAKADSDIDMNMDESVGVDVDVEDERWPNSF